MRDAKIFQICTSVALDARATRLPPVSQRQPPVDPAPSLQSTYRRGHGADSAHDHLACASQRVKSPAPPALFPSPVSPAANFLKRSVFERTARYTIFRAFSYLHGQEGERFKRHETTSSETKQEWESQGCSVSTRRAPETGTTRNLAYALRSSALSSRRQ